MFVGAAEGHDDGTGHCVTEAPHLVSGLLDHTPSVKRSCADSHAKATSAGQTML